MSWGERSCIYSGTGNCPNPEVSFNTCHTGCRFYKSNGNKTEAELLQITLTEEKPIESRVYKITTKKQIRNLKKKGKLR